MAWKIHLQVSKCCLEPFARIHIGETPDKMHLGKRDSGSESLSMCPRAQAQPVCGSPQRIRSIKQCYQRRCTSGLRLEVGALPARPG